MKKISLFFFIITILNNLYAQDDSDKLESWKGIKVTKELNNFKVNLSGEIRLKDYGEIYNQSLFEPELEYRFKFIKLGYNIRYINEYDDQGKITGFQNFIRNQKYIEFSQKINRTKISLKYIDQQKKAVKFNFSNKNIDYSRLQLNLAYNIKKFKFDPKIGLELFYKDDINFKNRRDKFRFKLGSEFGKKNKIKFTYIIENQLNKLTTHIIKSIYEINLN